MLIELFSVDVTAAALRANIGSKSTISLQRGPVDPKFQVERVAPIEHSSSNKIGLNGRSYGAKIRADLSSVLSQSTRLTDGQTDRQTAFSSLDSVCVALACSAVMNFFQLLYHYSLDVSCTVYPSSRRH